MQVYGVWSMQVYTGTNIAIHRVPYVLSTYVFKKNWHIASRCCLNGSEASVAWFGVSTLGIASHPPDIHNLPERYIMYIIL